jgi:hypothetical protein
MSYVFVVKENLFRISRVHDVAANGTTIARNFFRL